MNLTVHSSPRQFRGNLSLRPALSFRPLDISKRHISGHILKQRVSFERYKSKLHNIGNNCIINSVEFILMNLTVHSSSRQFRENSSLRPLSFRSSLRAFSRYRGKTKFWRPFSAFFSCQREAFKPPHLQPLISAFGTFFKRLF